MRLWFDSGLGLTRKDWFPLLTESPSIGIGFNDFGVFIKYLIYIYLIFIQMFFKLNMILLLI